MGATIAAVATGPAPGGIAVVRISGPKALQAALALAPDVPPAPVPRQAYLSAVVDRNGAPLDEGLFLYFAAPRSFTGEEVVELHLHGSPVLGALVVSELTASGELRLAEPGEFTRRAFLNGRLDLLRAEAIADLIGAQSAEGIRAAAAQLRGEVSKRVEAALSAIEDVSADVEGLLDFPEEAAGAEGGLDSKLERATGAVVELAEAAAHAVRRRRGGRVVLVGPVNAGKSSLFNALLGENRALVDAEPGTTRDVVESPWELKGLRATLVDTAGFRDEPGRLEAMGIERAQAALAEADVAVWVVPPGPEGQSASQRAKRELPSGVSTLWVHSKADLRRDAGGSVDARELHVSAQTGLGLEALRDALWKELGGGVSQAVGSFSQRSADALERARRCLKSAQEARVSATLEVVAGELALAREALEEAVGHGQSSRVLDAVFQRFCIGK